MNTLTVKIPEPLKLALDKASRRESLPRSELVRRAIEAYLASHAARGTAPSALAQAGDLVGCFSGGPKDLASNPRHLEGFGR